MTRDGPGAPPRRGRLGVATGFLLVAALLAACSSAAGHPAASRPSASVPATPSAASADGPLACVSTAKPAGGSGPWKLVPPSVLCGLPEETSAQYVQSGQSLASEDKLLLSMHNAGPVTSTVTAMYQGLSTAAQRATSFRSVSVVGFDGSFQTAAALSALEEQPEYTYTNASPGPHGGTLACANIEGSENCVWATATTVCEITILDPTGELIGANSAANAVRIRDALEVPA